MVSPSPLLRWPCLVVLAACQATPRPDTVVVRHEVALPAMVAAAVVGGALRHQLPFVDPEPNAHGVLVAAAGPHALRFAFAGDPRSPGGLRALATHRLHLREATAAAALPVATLVELPAALQAGGQPDFAVELRSTATGTCVLGELPATLARAVGDALAMAMDPDLVRPGQAESALVAVVQHRLAAATTAAMSAGDPARSHALRQQRARLPNAGADVHADLGVAAASSGDATRANDHCWQAMLGSDDPLLRSRMARQLDELQALGNDAYAWRRAARARLQDDPAAAVAMLHTASRLQKAHAADYRLLSQAHGEGAQPALAVPYALLAREHAQLEVALPDYLAELRLHATAPTAAAATTTAPAAPPR